MEFSKIKKIYFIGIKGVGMTMLAQYFAAQKIEIIGSDTAEVFMTDEVLKKSGIKIKSGFKAENLEPDADLIIYSTAYNNSNPEVAAALNSKIKTMTYGEALADIFNQNWGIAVAGSHGKTTTTAWLGFVLDRCGKHPSALVGASVPQFGGSSLIGSSNLLVAEADEYQNKLKLLKPKLIILNNIDYDHPDFFKTPENYNQAFADFVSKLGDKEILVANFDDANILNISKNISAKIISYALNNKQADYQAFNIIFNNNKQYFTVSLNGEDLGEFNIKLAGIHSVYNALAVIAAALELGCELQAVRGALGEFKGTARRLEALGEFKKALIIDDYAHHPTEIKASINALKQQYPDKRLWIAFHPHTFSRTQALLADFADCWDGVDKLIILEIYASAREAVSDFTSQDLIAAIKNKNKNLEIVYQPDLAACEKYLRDNLADGTVLALMGAGDVFRIGQNLIKLKIYYD